MQTNGGVHVGINTIAVTQCEQGLNGFTVTWLINTWFNWYHYSWYLERVCPTVMLQNKVILHGIEVTFTDSDVDLACMLRFLQGRFDELPEEGLELQRDHRPVPRQRLRHREGPVPREHPDLQHRPSARHRNQGLHKLTYGGKKRKVNKKSFQPTSSTCFSRHLPKFQHIIFASDEI